VDWLEMRFHPVGPSDHPSDCWMVVCQSGQQQAAPPASQPTAAPPLTAIIDGIGEAVIVLDQDLQTVAFNRAAERTFGYMREEVVGQPSALFPPLYKTLQPLLESVRASAAGPAKAPGTPLGHRAQGQSFPIAATVSHARADGKSIYTVVLRDITRQKQGQQAMAQSQKMLAIGALASGVAHDFNNILTAVLSHLDLAASEPTLPDTVRENVTYAQTSARRGAELVSKLLAFSRQTEAKLAPLNLDELSAEVVAMLRHSIDRRIEIRHELVTPPLWLVEGDGSQLMQVLMNLCLNARDAMPNGGRLCIRLENITGSPPPTVPHQDAREFVRLTVSDTGEGMPPEVLNRLFEPYFTTKAVGKGTGLGLSIAHSVVTEHGGWMEVESKLGEGSHFSACFPRASSSPRAVPQAPANLIPREECSLEGRETILVVDDDETVRLVVRAVLSYRGYQVTEACDGEEAVRRYEQTPGGFDLVLLDLNMPRLNGWDAMSRMQQLDPAVTIMLLSGGLTEGDIERAQRLGATTVLSKPFENPELVRLVRQTLDRAKRSAPSSGTEPAGRSRGGSACS